MHDGVAGILPTLIDETVRAFAEIFDEAIAVVVAVIVDPAERRFDVRPQVTHRIQIAGALEIIGGEQHEEWRGIGAAVIFPERHFPQHRHLAVTDFVQNLARLRVHRRIVLRRLCRGEKTKHALGEHRRGPERLKRRDQSVAAERRAKPWCSRARIRPLRRHGRQHLQIGFRALEQLGHQAMRAFDDHAAFMGLARIAPRRAIGNGIRLVGHRFRRAAIERHDDRDFFVRRQLEIVGGDTVCQRLRRRIETDAHGAVLAVEPRVIVVDAATVGPLGLDRSAFGPLRAAHLENIREVAAGADLHQALLLLIVEVSHGDALVAGVVPEEARTADVQRLARQDDAPAFVIDIRVGEVDRENDVVLVDRGTQQQRALPEQQQLEFRQVTHVVVKDAAGRKARIGDVAKLVEQREGIALLQRARPPLLDGCRCLDIERRGFALGNVARVSIHRRASSKSQ